MWRNLWLEGKITCTYRGEEKSTTFSGTHPNFDFLFSGNERFNFSLWAREEKKPNELAKIGETSRNGQIDFRVFLPGRQKVAYNGGTTFHLELNKAEYRLRWDSVAIIEGFKGGVGTVKIELSFKTSG